MRDLNPRDLDRWLTTDPRDTPECPDCEGTGSSDSECSLLAPACPTCGGSGEAPRPPEVEPVDTMCEQCAGNGRIEGGETCGSCIGHGSHPVPLHLLGLDEPALDEPALDPTPIVVVAAMYDKLDRLVEAVLGPPPPANSYDTLSHDDYDRVLAAMLVCSHPQFTALVPDGDLRGCDGCNLSVVAEPLLDWGLGWSTAYDTDGVPDVSICPACCLEYPDEPPLDDEFDLDALRREEQDAIDSMDGS